jgi:hypothetical protein
MRRLTWLAAGFGLGAVVAHRATQGGTQPVIATTAAGLAARVRSTLVDAVAEGRAEMRMREVRMREVFGTGALENEGVDASGDKGADRTRR